MDTHYLWENIKRVVGLTMDAIHPELAANYVSCFQVGGAAAPALLGMELRRRPTSVPTTSTIYMTLVCPQVQRSQSTSSRRVFVSTGAGAHTDSCTSQLQNSSTN
jgi:hypothetical protein